MPQEAKVIVNPASRNGQTGKVWPSLSEKMKASGFMHQWEMTYGPGDGRRIAREAVRQGFDRIVAVGGDGTVNEVINGLIENDCSINPDLVFGVLSMGTGCDFIKSVGIPGSVDDAIGHLVCNRVERVDVGKARFVGHDGQITERYFLNIADLGLGAETVDRVNHTTKVFGGFVSFLWGTLVSLLHYRNKVAEITIDDGEPIKSSLTLCAIANGTHFGGGMNIAPQAKLNDGLFDVVLCHGFSKSEIIVNLKRLYGGTHLSHPKVRYWQAAKLKVSSPEKLLLELDGEQPGVAEVEFSILPAALNLCVPAECSIATLNPCILEKDRTVIGERSQISAAGVPIE